jgi:DeoR/GlpR family transcriptional regulator of sugar metabolism
MRRLAASMPIPALSRVIVRAVRGDAARSFPPDRHAEILAVLDASGRVVSADVAARLRVSIDTVRRDLAELEALGALRRVHGGAVRPAPDPRRFADRLERDDGPRVVVAGLAAGLVPRDGLVAIAGGTTAVLVAQRLPRDLDATVVTSSPDVALALRDHPMVEVDLLGGHLHRTSQTVTGGDTIAQLRALRPDACVVSACGVDPDVGVTFRERDEALVVRTMIERSARSIVLASADKLGSASPYVVAPAARVDVLVTDAPRTAVAAYERLGVAVVTPDARRVLAA